MCKHLRNRAIAAISFIASACLLVAAGCTFFAGGSDAGRPFVHYAVHIADRKLNLVRVTVDCYGFAGRNVRFAAEHGVETVPFEPVGCAARDAAGSVLGVDENEGVWVVESGGRDFSLVYDVVLTIEDRYSPDVTRMISCLQGDRLRFLGRDLFLVPEGRLSDGVLLDVEPFPGRGASSAWPGNGNRLAVPGIEDLLSTVVVSGDYRLLSTRTGRTELHLAIAGGWSFADSELMDVIRRIVSGEMALFGSSPHERYLFVCDRNPVRGGRGFNLYGMHFTGSMVLLLDPRLDRSELFDTPMSIIAHEFFHNWNGEVLRPRTGGFLWFTEGVTVYYSYKVLIDMNIITPRQYARKREEIARRYLENGYLESVPVGEAANSDLADKDMVNLLYDGGFLAAEALDNHIAKATGGRLRLIDVLRSMYEEAEGPVCIDEAVLVDSIRRMCGSDMGVFLDELIHTPAPAILVSASQSS